MMKALNLVYTDPRAMISAPSNGTTPTKVERLSPLRNNLLNKVALPTMEGVSIERIDNIISLEACGNYTKINFVDARQLLVCKTLQDVEVMLEHSAQFVRVHRSHTINIDRLQRYVKGKSGYVMMENNTKIDVSLGKKQELLDALRLFFGYE